MSKHDLKSFFLALSFAALSSALSSPSNALVITIEPDDYAVGTDLSTISQYLTFQSASNGFSCGKPFSQTCTSTLYVDEGGPLGGNYTAPTGTHHFGNAAYGFVGGGTQGPDSRTGLGLLFNEEVNHLTLLANSVYAGLPAEWVAFDKAGNTIGKGTAGSGLDIGETFLIDIRMNDIWSVVLGGADQIGALTFDHLTFDIADDLSHTSVASVPEPSTLLLFIPGLLLLSWRRKDRGWNFWKNDDEFYA